MLDLCNFVSEYDARKFVAHFRAINRSGTGRLSREEIALLAQSGSCDHDRKNRSFTLRNHKRSPFRSCCQWFLGGQNADSRKRIRVAVRLVLPPSTVCVMGVIWHSVFGYVLLSASVFTGFACSMVLVERPSPLRLRVAAGIAVVSALLISTVILELQVRPKPAPTVPCLHHMLTELDTLAPHLRTTDSSTHSGWKNS